MKSRPPDEPTRRAIPRSRGRGDTRPPAPPSELERPPERSRRFSAGADEWIAALSGKGAWGTGSYGLGLVDAVHFFRADAPERPVREALLARGRFESLFETELAELLERSVPITERADG
jgi:hypothetical protein